MRFPKTPFMWRTFHLLEDVLPTKLKNQPKDVPQIFKYFFDVEDGKSSWHCYNGYRLNDKEFRKNAELVDPFHIDEGDSRDYIPGPWKYLLNPVKLAAELEGIMSSLVSNFKEDGSNLQEALHELIQSYDQFSMRSYLASKGYPTPVINLLETFDKSTGWYDRGLVETVCEYLAFQWVRDNNNNVRVRNDKPDYFFIE
jgi:hypothetical protein